ncbi:aspartyl protease family protein [Neiella sp. HB171785]|uniref:Aspartyl protease family protein n=1 Tax=Neiella litorisoli TaxID=2771431 RepID=A0A8J6UJ83_9GAMM|nr:pepsin/retropepsin-like aspartic protease family protein [Neiella litorisoli]MBD1390093.1 aspartyl protease family protein [Neiella litorisoli]
MKYLRNILALGLAFVSLSSTAAITEWIEFSRDSGHIRLPCKIAGIDGYAIIDSGANTNAINRAFITKYDLEVDKGMPIIMDGAFGEQRTSLVNNIQAHVFSTDAELDQLALLSIGPPENQIILGHSFLERFIVQFDYPNSRMRLMTREHVDLKSVANLDTRSNKGSKLPIVKVSMNNEEDAWLLLDTGNNGGVIIKRGIAEHNDWLDRFELSDVEYSGVNKTSVMQEFVLPSIQFGPFELSDVPTLVPSKGSKINLMRPNGTMDRLGRSRKVQGIIGYDVLKHFVLTLDVKYGRAHIALPAA